MRRPLALAAIGLAVAGLMGLGAGLTQLAGSAYLPVVLRDWPATPPPTGPTPTPTVTRAADRFTLQPGSPAYLPNFDNGLDCQWLGFSGQVFDLWNRGIIGLQVIVDGGGPQLAAVTGSAPRYGPSGWVLTLGNAPLTTTDTYRLQLRDGNGQPLSATVVIPTWADCHKNQVIVNFVQNH